MDGCGRGADVVGLLGESRATIQIPLQRAKWPARPQIASAGINPDRVRAAAAGWGGPALSSL